MNQRHPLEEVVARRQCMGCGLCTAIRPSPGQTTSPAVTMAYQPTLDQFAPSVANWRPGEPTGEFVCPGADMDMPALADAVHGRQPVDPILGETLALRAGWAVDPEVRSRSASGGVTTALLAHLFEEGRIDAAYVVKTTQGPREAAGVLVRGTDELSEIHGSVYQPANFGAALQALLAGQERFAFVGLPCEIAGLEMLKRQRPELAARHVTSIGLFCGGINRFAGIDYYLKRFGLRLDGLRQIDFRSGPWPGAVRALTRDGEERRIPRIRGNSRWNILRYVVAFQGPWMLARCRLCPDQVADFADIAVGDPHLPRFRARGGQGFSAVISRTPRGEALVSSALAAGAIGEEPISRNEVVESQGYTLDNRRHVRASQRVARFLGFKPPNIRVYEALEGRETARHYRYAAVDMVKIALVRVRWLKPFYVPMQAMEYLFITFAPSLVARRVMKLIKNAPD